MEAMEPPEPRETKVPPESLMMDPRESPVSPVLMVYLDPLGLRVPKVMMVPMVLMELTVFPESPELREPLVT